MQNPPTCPAARRTSSHEELARVQAETLAAPRRHYGLLARMLFTTLDTLYGKKRTLSKFKVLELVARVPYQAWEQVAYIAITHMHGRRDLARRISRPGPGGPRAAGQRAVAPADPRRAHRQFRQAENRLYYFWIPQAIALVYYQISWLLFVLRPDWSYRLNADFEDHAEHEYMHLVTEHPEWETTPFDSDFAADYGSFDSVADLFRQIGHDERFHKEESIAALASPRFS